jgi:sodium/hydrogen exchanger family protein
VIVGALLAYLMFPGIGWAVAALIAIILAPTDAALGLAVVTNKAVPVRIRRALNVESGLNDGIATPLVTLFIAIVVAEDLAYCTSQPRIHRQRARTTLKGFVAAACHRPVRERRPTMMEPVRRIELAWHARKVALCERPRAKSDCEKCPEDSAEHRPSPCLMAR